MEESLGMVMVFTIISSSIEWLGSKWEEIKSHEAEDIRKKKEVLDAEEKVSQNIFNILLFHLKTFS
jgi:hypothetical protein